LAAGCSLQRQPMVGHEIGAWDSPGLLMEASIWSCRLCGVRIFDFGDGLKHRGSRGLTSAAVLPASFMSKSGSF
jgi:hypothetical protein